MKTEREAVAEAPEQNETQHPAESQGHVLDAASELRWISVEERMPEPETECLVRAKPTYAKEPYTAIDTWGEQHEAPVSFSSATIPIGMGWDTFLFEEVTHWMLLPPAPKE